MPFVLNDQVCDRVGNVGTVKYAYYNRARQEWCYSIQWGLGTPISMDENDIRKHKIEKVQLALA